MAAVNGTYSGEPGYGKSTANYGSVASSAPASSDVSKEEVAWFFVESYYTTMSKNPEKLHLFFNRRSQWVCGVEEEKSSVAVGQKVIKERITDLDYQDCKVRVTNVDSQGSDENIVIQVLGEISNKSKPHRKFAQTFVLAGQTNGYFVLNDIFRYIKEDEEEPEQEAAETGATEEAAPVEEEPAKEVVQEEEIAAVDEKLEEAAAAEETPAVNGTPVPEPEEVVEAEDAPAAVPVKEEDIDPAVTKEDLQPEKPQDPSPSPAPEPAKAAAPVPAAPPKPAVPRTWAQLASANRASAAAAPSTTTAAKPAAPTATPSAPTPSAPAAQSAPAPAARDVSPDSNKDGSQGGWQTAGAGHDRKQSRSQNAPMPGQDGRIRAYVKNVTTEVDADALKTLLSKFGEVVYFDVARQKNAAFVEFKTQAAFQAAVAANPHRIGSIEMNVEERRMNQGGSFRGGARGGRGGFDNRGPPRGGFGGRGGRGGSGNVTPRGGRGGAQAA